MSRFFYTVLWYIGLPLVLVRLYWRGRRQLGYRQHIAERFGRHDKKLQAPVIWVHAVSVGETRAALPLVESLLKEYPEHPLLLTCMTPTGRETALSVYGNRVEVAYLPYDLPWAIRRFLKHFRPVIGIFMETELWPNLLASCQQQNVPTALVNARLSERSARGYGRIRALIEPALSSLKAVAAQTPDDAKRLQHLGARHVQVCGNLKFDIVPPLAMLERGQEFRQWFGNKRVILTASTREGEEALLLAARPKLWPADWLWVIVPRHPQRFDEVASQVGAEGLQWQRRSEAASLAPVTQVWLGDSMGEMFAYYAACDLAFIGGSLLPFGAQNLIEAAAVGKPVLIGPHTFNFAEATRLAIEAGHTETVETAAVFWQRVGELLNAPDELAARGQAGLAFSAQHRGATMRVMDVVRQAMAERSLAH